MSQRSVRLRRREILFPSARRQRRILSRFGMTKYPPCGDAVCLNLTRLTMRRSVHLNSERFAARRYCKRRRAFKISLLNFKRRKPCFEILLLNSSPRASRLNLKRRLRRISWLAYGSSSHSRTATAKIFPRKAQFYSTPYSARHGALYSLLRCCFDGAIIQRAAAPSLRYARLLRRYLRYPLPSFGAAAMTPHAVAALFCAACTAPSSASLFCRTLHRFEIYLKF